MKLPKLYLAEWAVIAGIVTVLVILVYAAMNSATQ